MDEVGKDAARFIFSHRRPDAQLEFDLEVAKQQSSDNPVYYVQYAHARLASVFRQAAAQGIERQEMDPAPISRLTCRRSCPSSRCWPIIRNWWRGRPAIWSRIGITYFLTELAAQLH